MAGHPLIAELDTDRVDVIGDVHGEIEPLRALLQRLGVDTVRKTAQRPLVFVGDLVDRGPDSVAVLELVGELVAAGIAHVVLGNHEFNLLANDKKEGNGWFWGDDTDHWTDRDHRRHFFASRLLTSELQREEVRRFLRTLPFALHTPGLRVVHAAWRPEALDWLRQQGTHERVIQFDPPLPPPPIDAPDEASLKSRAPRPAYHSAFAELEAERQSAHPGKLLTSGPERAVGSAAAMKYLSGKWRMVEREPWWQSDDDERPVLFGHYWRRRVADGNSPREFANIGPTDWFGPRRQAFCVDFSVGYTFKARVDPTQVPLSSFALAAMRMPERELVFHDGWRPG
jgi:hypothetical protein